MFSFSTTNKIVRRFQWFLAACALLFGAYGVLPLMLESVAEHLLARHGFSEIKVDFGYPSLRQTTIRKLSFSKKIGGDRWHLSLDHLFVDYHLSGLLDGQIQRLDIRQAMLKVISQEEGEKEAPAGDALEASPESSLIQRLTVQEILAPLPVLPLSHLILTRLTIHRPQARPQFQHLEIAGAWHYYESTLNGTFTIQGPHIPTHHVALSGRGIGNMRFSLHKVDSVDHPILHLQSHLQPDDTHANLQGSFKADIHQCVDFLSLFHSLPPSLSKATGTVQANYQGKISPEHSLATLRVEHISFLEGSWRTTFTLPQVFTYGSNLSVNLEGEISKEGSQLAWTISPDSRISAALHLDSFPIPQPVQAMFPEGRPRIRVDFPQSVTGYLAFTRLTSTKTPQLTMDGPIRIRYGTNTSPLALKVALTQLSANLLGPSQGKGTLTMSALWRGPAQSFLPIHKARSDLSGEVSFDTDQLQITLSPPSTLKAGLFQHQDITIPRAQFSLEAPTTLVYRMETQAWNLNQTLVTIQAPHLRWKAQKVTMEQLRLQLDQAQGNPSSWQAKGQFAVDGLHTKIAGLSPPATNWNLQFSVKSHGVQANLQGGTRDGNIAVSGRLHHDWLHQNGRLNLSLSPIHFSPSTGPASNLLQPWPYPMDLTTGTISGSARLAWAFSGQPHTPVLTEADLYLRMNEGGGFAHTLFFEGLTTDIHLTGPNPWRTREPATLTIRQVLSGITVSNISMKLDAAGNRSTALSQLELREFSATVFGGRVTSDPIVFNQNLQTKPFVLSLEQVDLGQILVLEQQKGLQGTGALDGRIPLILRSDGIEVQQGRLEARPPGGVIRFQPAPGTTEALTRSNSNMNLALTALRNFEYTHLAIDVGYEPDGTLKLGVQLQGKNPELQNGRPINFNVTVEENIPALLKTLRIAHGLERQIEGLLKKGEEGKK